MADIDRVIHSDGADHGRIYCVWGEFSVQRQIINGGIRFILPQCPNAFSWTITTGYDPAPDKAVINCTINRTEHDPDFIDSIESFVESWKQGLESAQRDV